MSEKLISIFKSYLKVDLAYRGGKTKDELRLGGKKLHKLSSNENLLGSSPKALQAIRDNIDKLNEYPDRIDTRLQTALEEYYKGELKAGQFITGPSGSEVLELIIRGFLEPGLEIIISNPTFLVYQMFSQKQGAKVIDIPLTDPDYGLNVDGILEAINENTRIIFLTSPNNPTGTYIPEANLSRVINNVPDHVVVVLDEVYFHYTTADDYCRALPYVKAGKKVIGINSFSKAYGLAGLRIGYAYSTPELAAYIRQLYKPFMINTLAMHAAVAALSDQEFLDRTVNLVNTEKEFIYKAFNELGVHYWKSQANFVLIKPDIDEYEFETLMQQEGVMVRPVANFGAPGRVRITIGTHEANVAMVEAVRKLKAK